MESHFNNAVEMIEWLDSVTPDELASARSQGPYRDQLDAAADEVRRTESENLGGKPIRSVDPNTVGDWLRLGLYDTLLAWSKGEVQTCVHRPTMGSPEPCWAVAWMPGKIACKKCVWQFTVTGDLDRTCDGCGRVVDGMPDDGITPVSIFAGSLCYEAGACLQCYASVIPPE
jgi:hypothetical protein